MCLLRSILLLALVGAGTARHFLVENASGVMRVVSREVMISCANRDFEFAGYREDVFDAPIKCRGDAVDLGLPLLSAVCRDSEEAEAIIAAAVQGGRDARTLQVTVVRLAVRRRGLWPPSPHGWSLELGKTKLLFARDLRDFAVDRDAYVMLRREAATGELARLIESGSSVLVRVAYLLNRSAERWTQDPLNISRLGSVVYRSDQPGFGSVFAFENHDVVVIH